MAREDHPCLRIARCDADYRIENLPIGFMLQSVDGSRMITCTQSLSSRLNHTALR